MPLSLVDAYGTSRRSPLFRECLLVHADLHNHTWLSDGAGDPGEAFAVMRRSGLDVAALTDHAKLDRPLDGARGRLTRQLVGIDESAWRQAGELADAANEDDGFVAFRGFEWSHPTLGHVCVWGSDVFLAPFRTAAQGMRPLFDFLAGSPAAASAMASFNHPGGRRTRRFGGFEFHPELRQRWVGLEMFNKTDDYAFAGVQSGRQSPLIQCLRQGWRPGLVGVSDEHGTDWGGSADKGRTGVYVRELTRAGVREALLARRTFASRVKGLRLAVTAGGVPMGEAARHRSGPLPVVVDIDMGPESWRNRVGLQVLRPGERVPVLAAAEEVRIPAAGEAPVCFAVDVDANDGEWLVVRVTDPEAAADAGTPPAYAGLGRSLAYASPIWLDPGTA